MIKIAFLNNPYNIKSSSSYFSTTLRQLSLFAGGCLLLSMLFSKNLNLTTLINIRRRMLTNRTISVEQAIAAIKHIGYIVIDQNGAVA